MVNAVVVEMATEGLTEQIPLEDGKSEDANGNNEPNGKAVQEEVEDIIDDLTVDEPQGNILIYASVFNTAF